MAVTRIGSVTEFQAGSGNTGSTSITVPSDAEVVLIGVHGYVGTANIFTGGAITIGGVTCTLEVAADGNTGFFMGAMFGLDVRSLLGSQTMAWDWSGASALSNAPRFVYAFYKGLDMGAPFRDSDAVQAGAVPFTTPTLTAQSGDLMVAWGFAFDGGAAPGAPTWSNATAVSNFLTLYQSGAGSWAEGSPSGNTTVGIASPWSPTEDGGVAAAVLVAAPTAPAPGTPSQFDPELVPLGWF